MRSKLFVILGLLLILAAEASGQTKITGTLSCGKPDPAYAIEVGDRTGHSVSISKFACTWTTPMEYGEVQSKDVRFQGNDTTMDGKPGTTEGTWSYAGGTGKFKGIK